MIRSLSFHSSYRCEHSGECCTAGWPIAIEPDRLTRVRAAIASRALRARTPAPIVETDDSGAGLLAADRDGCTFYDPHERRCRVQSMLGHQALPLACRQFPRVSMRDPRGVSVTLSHYCPTAAHLLDDDAPVAIVSDARAFPAGGEYAGLDASDVPPPLLRPGVLMDWTAWWECERLAVCHLGNSRERPAETVETLAGAVAQLQTWTPGAADPLIDRVRSVFDVRLPHRRALPPSAELVRRVRRRIPAELRPVALPSGRPAPDRVINRFLAAHAFASWSVLGPGGLDAWVESIAAAHALLDSGFGVRQADLWLRHLAQ